VLTHRIRLDDFVTFTTYLLMLTWPSSSPAMFVQSLLSAAPLLFSAFHELLIAKAHHRRPRKPSCRRRSTEILGDVEFRDLHFAYPAETAIPSEVLHGISLRNSAGTSLALVGPRPAPGKSTLVSLIPRICDAPPGARAHSTAVPSAITRSNASAPAAGRSFVPAGDLLFSTTNHGQHRVRRFPAHPHPKSVAPRGSRAHS